MARINMPKNHPLAEGINKGLSAYKIISQNTKCEPRRNSTRFHLERLKREIFIKKNFIIKNKEE